MVSNGVYVWVVEVFFAAEKIDEPPSADEKHPPI